METYKEFKQELRRVVQDTVTDLNAEDFIDFSEWLFLSVFDLDGEYELEDVSKQEIFDLLEMLDYDDLKYVFDMLSDVSIEDYSDDYENAEIETELEEAVAPIMKRKNMNKQKVKKFKIAKAQFRSNIAIRKKENRLSRADRKKYYRTNKKKISRYQKSYKTAIDKSTHIKKIRV